MTEATHREFRELDLTGARFENVRLSDSQFHLVRFDGSSYESVSFAGVRMKGVQILDAEISGDVDNVRINGVDIGPLITAELNRRDPQRHLVYQEGEHASLANYRAGWEVLSARWTETIERVKALPAGSEHVSVEGEWSLVQTLRHVSYALAAWIERVAMGRESPFVASDLPWDTAPESIPRDRDAPVLLEDAVAQWEKRRDTVSTYLAGLDEVTLNTAVVTQGSAGYPQVEDFPVREAVHVALTETWEHRAFAERDLAKLAASSDTDPPTR